MTIQKNAILHTSQNKKDTLKIIEKIFSIKVNRQNNSFASDTIKQLNYKFIAFGRFSEIDLSLDYFKYFPDSIFVISPIESILKFDDCITSFGYFNKMKFNTSDMIIISDINIDGINDFAVYNDCLSGNGQNSTFDYWINDGFTLRLDTEFSVPNLGYNNKNKEYYSRSSAGGGNITETYYKLKSGKLKALRSIETKYIDDDKLKYTKIDFIKNDTIIEIKKYKR